MDQLIESMKKLLANNFAFYIKAHGFHWNVEGSNFPQYHQLFATIYEDTYGAVDKLAELIRTLDGYPPASFKRYMELSDIADELKIPNGRGMVERLLADSDIMLESLQAAYDLAEKHKKHGLSNFLAERMDAHSKHKWQLSATLKSN